MLALYNPLLLHVFTDSVLDPTLKVYLLVRPRGRECSHLQTQGRSLEGGASQTATQDGFLPHSPTVIHQ